MATSSASCEPPRVAADEEQEGPYSWPELRAALEERRKRERALLDLRAKVRNRMFLLQQRAQRGEIDARQLGLEQHKLKLEATREAEQLLFGQSGARDAYLKQFGCVKWSEAAMAALQRLGAVVELGAGNGRWLAAMRARGVDAIGIDDGSALPLQGSLEEAGIRLGDEKDLKGHGDRALLLVCPPPGDMALRALKAFPGRDLVFVGEGRGGAHACEAFFDALERDWELQEVIDVEPFSECHERCFVLRRKPGWLAWMLGRA